MSKLKVMNAQIGHEADLEKKDYIFEPKLDGYRALCTVEGKKITLTSRGGIDITDKYPNITAKNLLPYINAKNCILDGEIVAYDKDGNPNFNKLQKGEASSFVAFDILEKNGKMLLDKPLLQRKEILAETVDDGPHIQKVPFTRRGKTLWKEMLRRKLEGVMAKEVDGLYHAGKRHKTWLKIKFNQTIDCIIIGYTSEKRAISSLALGLYNEEGKLRYIGKVGTGFYHLIDKLKAMLSGIKINDMPLNPPKTGKTVTWVKPKYVAEIRYLEITKGLILRSPVLERLRPDKKASSCTIKDQT